MQRKTKKQFMTLQDLLDRGFGLEQIVKFADQITLSEDVVWSAVKMAIDHRDSDAA
jgi:hypothetical protein